MSVSIVVVSWNSAADIGESVRSGREQGAEVIVVDNASSDNSPEVARRAGANVVIEAGGNLGFGRGCNLGLERASGGLILFLNPDARLEPGAVDGIERFFQEHPDADIVGPAIHDESGRKLRSAGPPWSLAMEVLNKTVLHRLLPGPAGTLKVGWVTGAALAGRTESVRRLGGFDPKIFLYYEDLDLGARARAQGMSIWFTDSVGVVHKGKRSSNRVEERALVASHLSAEHYWRKHGGQFSWIVFRAITIPEMVLRALMWSLLALSPSRRTQARGRLRAYRRILAIAVRGQDSEDSPDFHQAS